MGRKGSKTEVEARISTVHRLLCAGATRAQILRYGSDTWGLCDRQVEDYIAKARQTMIEAHKEAREDALALELARRNELLQAAWQQGKLFTALQIADSRARLLGLFNSDRSTSTTTTGIELRLVTPENIKTLES